MLHEGITGRSTRRIAGWPFVVLAMAVASSHCSVRGQDDINDRRERLRAMTAAEKEEIRRKEKRFQDLSAEEQARLRDLHAEVSGANDAEKLREVMERYYEWLKTLRPGERAEILSLPPDERIEKIRGMLEEQSIQRFQRMAASQLERQDVTLIFRWIGDYVTSHDEELLASLTDEKRKIIDENPRSRRFVLTGALMQKDASAITVSEDEINRLIEGLSRPAQQILQNEKDKTQQIRIIRGWMDAAASSMFRNPGPPRAPVSNEQILQFVEKELNERDRAYLDGLPAERFRREAERLYNFYKYRHDRDNPNGIGPSPGEPGRFRPFRPGGDQRQGPRGDGPRGDGPRGDGTQDQRKR